MAASYPGFYNDLHAKLSGSSVKLPTFDTRHGQVQLCIRKKMTHDIEKLIRPLFGDFCHGINGYLHYEGAVNCNTCWKFAHKYLLVVNSEFVPLVSQFDLPACFNDLKEAIEKAPYSYKIKVVTDKKYFGVPLTTGRDGTKYEHLSIGITEPVAKQADRCHLKSIQVWLDNVLAIEKIGSDLRQLDTWSAAWDDFEEKLKSISTLNFFNWIRSFQRDVAKNEEPYIATVLKYLFNTIQITRDTYSVTGWLVKLPVWDQLRNTFMRAVIEATKESDSTQDLKIISEKVVDLLKVWLHPTNIHKHSVSEDGTVTAKTAKRLQHVIDEFNLDKITGSFTTLSEACETSGLSLDFRNLKKVPNNGLLGALNSKKVTKPTEFNAWHGGLHTIGKNISAGVSGPTLRPSMSLQEFADAIHVLIGRDCVSHVEIDVVDNPPPAIMGSITSGPDHERFFKNPKLLSTCWTNVNNRVRTLDYHGMRNMCVKNRLPVAGMCTNNEYNLHFAISGASPHMECGIPSWRGHITGEWFQIIDQSKVGDFINKHAMLAKPGGNEQLVCGVLESLNSKTGDFYTNPVVYVTYKNGTEYKVTLTGGKHTDPVWNKPVSAVHREQVTPSPEKSAEMLKETSSQSCGGGCK